jgi:hypothetical protein
MIMEETKHGIFGTLFSAASVSSFISNANTVLTFLICLLTLMWWFRKVILRAAADWHYFKRWKLPPTDRETEQDERDDKRSHGD